MPELLLELFSEEIPARMQARAADDLLRFLADALAPAGLVPSAPRVFHGPRRIALSCVLPSATAAETREERGPRQGAPIAAIEAFCRGKARLAPEAAAEAAALLATGGTFAAEGVSIALSDTGKGVFVLARLDRPGRATADVLAEVIPAILRRFPWPKSMRWGGTSAFTWVRPLKRILCLFDGAVVPFGLRHGDDDGHGLASGDLTEGHRLMSPGAFAVTNAAEWEAGLRARHVVADGGERLRFLRDGITALAEAEGLEVVPDEALMAEIAGLVEWPVPLLARIDDAFMDLPPEAMRTTMRANQKYVSLRHPDGRAAPRFALVANIAASDGGAAIIAGNERVLRARLSDARFFWDQDRKQRLEAWLPKLDSVVFHQKLGTQGQRVARLEKLATWLAPRLGADPVQAGRAARLAKADLATGMVGEFPELQGIMGRYYAQHDGEAPEVAAAIGEHYRPAGPGDLVPAAPVSVAVALADKLDQLAGFFALDERPTGSGDPYALRRAALGVIRIIRENALRLGLSDAIGEAFFGFPQAVGATASPEFGMAVATEVMATGWSAPANAAHPPMVAAFAQGLLQFIGERLRVQLRVEGERHDIVAAAFGAGGEDDLVRLLARADAVREMLEHADGADLLAAYRRAANILRIESKKDGAGFADPVDQALLGLPAESELASGLATGGADLAQEDFHAACTWLMRLSPKINEFFAAAMINDPDRAIRANRLRLLQKFVDAVNRVADLSKIEG
ncbi:glycine--tRNA ligase subunit beta [Humitalea sp. 24SJ18S-53]|uniref:glycine--tRNA ligase subunit beta n=1 Tax=Humitalea sp. 24SJ18S-53 TaxID=3422307 RepID=UPI003D6798D9